MTPRFAVRGVAIVFILSLVACNKEAHRATASPPAGSTRPAAAGGTTAADPAASAPAAGPEAAALHFSPIVLLVIENQEEPDLIGDDAAPFLTGLARDHTLLTQSFGVAHTSLPNYLALISGETFGIRQDCNRCFQDAPTVVDQLEAAGHSWMAYFEDLPSPCGLGDTQSYAQHHNPFVYFAAVRSDAARCAAHIAAFDRLSQDIAAGTLADFVWITPNLCHDLHNCSVAEGDSWLGQFIPQLLATPAFQPGGSGLLIVTTDEGTSDDGCCGDAAGGHIATIFVSPELPPHSTIDVPISHYGILRLLEDNWGLEPLGHAGDAAGARQLFSAIHDAPP
jgi:hypothetical protein